MRENQEINHLLSRKMGDVGDRMREMAAKPVDEQATALLKAFTGTFAGEFTTIFKMAEVPHHLFCIWVSSSLDFLLRFATHLNTFLYHAQTTVRYRSEGELDQFALPCWPRYILTATPSEKWKCAFFSEGGADNLDSTALRGLLNTPRRLHFHTIHCIPPFRNSNMKSG